jgi:DNA gyrase/topoisomerase IV subunit A
MQANMLNLLKEFKGTPYYAAVLQMLDNEATRQLSEMVVAQSETRIRHLQGGVQTLEGLRKLFEDVDLLRSLLDNANEHPVVDKEK